MRAAADRWMGMRGCQRRNNYTWRKITMSANDGDRPAANSVDLQASRRASGSASAVSAVRPSRASSPCSKNRKARRQFRDCFYRRRQGGALRVASGSSSRRQHAVVMFAAIPPARSQTVSPGPLRSCLESMPDLMSRASANRATSRRLCDSGTQAVMSMCIRIAPLFVSAPTGTPTTTNQFLGFCERGGITNEMRLRLRFKSACTSARCPSSSQ